MKLVLFDIDGTLIDNRNLRDDGCFVRALEKEFGIQSIDMDWSRYPHATDSCVTRVLLERRFGRPATDAEVRRARDVYVEELRAAFATDHEIVTPIRGVRAALDRVRSEGWSLALVSGGWRTSALLKLHHARLRLTKLPGAFADDHVSREGIARIAKQRAEIAANRAADRVVYVGDAVWDVKACAALAFPFVGIGADADRLRAAGAATVLPDYSDVAAFLAALETAGPPVASVRT